MAKLPSNRDVLEKIEIHIRQNRQDEVRREYAKANNECENVVEENAQTSHFRTNTSEITVVRRSGEGTRPIFDRDEIVNHRRLCGHQERRYIDELHAFCSGERRRGRNDSCRTRISSREEYERQRDNFHRRSNLRRYSASNGISNYSCETEDRYDASLLFRTRSDDVLSHWHSCRCGECPPEEFAYYQFQNPIYYDAFGNIALYPASSDYLYYSDYEYYQ